MDKQLSNTDEVPSLRGWFLKEKRDIVKRRSSALNVMPSSNRRWFTIESITNNRSAKEVALCYYKKSGENEERCGWLFLDDVLSLTQDVSSRYITIEHPTRILRIQSPTPAQHRVWFSTLAKCCKNVRKEVVSPLTSINNNEDDRRPSLPYFDDSARKARRESLKNVSPVVITTPKDQLQFIRSLNNTGSEEVNKNLFEATSSSSSSSSFVKDSESVVDHTDDDGLAYNGEEHLVDKETASNTEFSTDVMRNSNDKTNIVPSYTLPSHYEEEKAEIEPLESLEGTAEETKVEESSFKDDTDDDKTDTFDLDQLKKALASGDSSQLLRTLSKSQSFSSAK